MAPFSASRYVDVIASREGIGGYSLPLGIGLLTGRAGNAALPAKENDHDLCRRRKLHQVQIHGLRRSLPRGLLLRGGEYACDPSG